MQSITNINLGIVCPMANERENAEKFVLDVIEMCKKYNFRSVTMYTIFDNVCTDGTYGLLKEKDIEGLSVVFAPEKDSVVDAYMRGYKEALDNGNDWILEIDAGIQSSAI